MALNTQEFDDRLFEVIDAFLKDDPVYDSLMDALSLDSSPEQWEIIATTLDDVVEASKDEPAPSPEPEQETGDTFMLNQIREWLADFASAEIDTPDDVLEWQREAASLEAQEAVLVASTVLSEAPEQDELPNCEACGNTRQMRASAPMVGEMLTPCPFCVPVNAVGDTTEVMWLRAEYHSLIAERDALRKALQPFAEKYRHALESNVALGMAEPAYDREYRVQYQHLKQAADALGE